MTTESAGPIQDRLDALCEMFGLNESELARFVGVTPPAVQKWKHGNRPPFELADAFGVSYDWLRAKSSQMWSEDVARLRKESHILANDCDATTMSARAKTIILWMQSQAPDVVTDRWLCALLRLDRSTLLNVLVAGATIGSCAVERLAAFTTIPVAWFVSGDTSKIVTDDHNAIIERMTKLGVKAADAHRWLDRIEDAQMSR